MSSSITPADIIGKPDSEVASPKEAKASAVKAEAKEPKEIKEKEVKAPVEAKVEPKVAAKTDEPAAPSVPSSAEATKAETTQYTSRDIPVEPVRPRRSYSMGASMGSRDGGYSRGGMRGGMRNGGMRDGGMKRSRYAPMQQNDDQQDRPLMDSDGPTSIVTGFLDTSTEGHGVVRVNFIPSEGDAYIATSQIRRLRLRPGDVISGPARAPKENERYWGMLKVDTVNGKPPEELGDRVKFQSLTPVYPNKQIKLETGDEPLATRIVDMVAHIGRGQRSLIVSPPKAGKTSLLMEMATGIAANYPEIHLMAVLVGERAEEVTDFRRHIERITKGKGEVAASNFDESAEDQCHVAEIALERAKRLVEQGRDVVILLDSITRLARAYNLSIPTSGRTLSGGFDPAALFPPKKFFGAARNFEVAGSLTIIGTALVDTGSRMDDLVFEEFKGTGNQEVHLDRRLAERRIYPAIDVQRSGTRRDDLLMDPMTYQSIMTLQRMLDLVDKDQRSQTLLDRLKRTSSNKEFLASLKEG